MRRGRPRAGGVAPLRSISSPAVASSAAQPIRSATGASVSSRSRRSARTGRGSPVTRSVSSASSPWRAARQRFSAIRQDCGESRSSRSAQPRDERVRVGRDRGGLAHGRLRVAHADLQRAEGQVRAQLEPPALRVARPAQHLRVLRPGGDLRRHALAREHRADQRPHGREARVAAGVEGRVGGQRGELRQVPAQRVVDGERGVGVADRDVHLQRAHELHAGGVAVVGEDRVVALAAIERRPEGRRTGCTPAAITRARPSARSASRRRPAASSATASATRAAGAVATSACEAGSSSLRLSSPSSSSRAIGARSSDTGSTSITSSSRPTVSGCGASKIARSSSSVTAVPAPPTRVGRTRRSTTPA